MGIERSPQLRGNRSEIVAIVDCRGCEMMCENLFSDTIVSQIRVSAQADNNRVKISYPKRPRLTDFRERERKKSALHKANFSKYSERESNPHGHYWPQDFKSGVSTYSTIRALFAVQMYKL